MCLMMGSGRVFGDGRANWGSVVPFLSGKAKCSTGYE